MPDRRPDFRLGHSRGPLVDVVVACAVLIVALAGLFVGFWIGGL